ncbi:hypothetical protein [Sporomusa sphaeroides]|nr:hypothetical protein [Sporomusa sphaeroides]HML33800.1 hypothetical protein [Sporomusa sphaeroides]
MEREVEKTCKIEDIFEWVICENGTIIGDILMDYMDIDTEKNGG